MATIENSLRSQTAPRPAFRLGKPTLKDADLLVLGTLIVLTAMFGRKFSHLGLASISLYTTELLLALTAILAVARVGVARAVGLIRTRVPTIALGIFWLVGAIAIARGLTDWGISLTLDDVGLIEYSLLIPLVVIVVDSTERLHRFVGVLACGGLAAMLVVAANEVHQLLGFAGQLIPSEGAPAFYITLYVAWVASRLAHDQPLRWIHGVGALAGLVLIGLDAQRSVWMAALAALVAIILVAASGRRPAVALTIVSAVTVAALATYGIQKADLSVVDDTPGVPTSTPAVIKEVHGITGGSSTEGQNAQWRVDYWGELISRSAAEPLGAGFGRPARFVWHDRDYDFRDGPPTKGIDEAGPHNGFVDVLYRLGWMGAFALVILLVVTLLRSLRASRGALRSSFRADGAAAVSILAASCGVIALTDGLRGPFLGIFFWIAIGSLCAWTGVSRSGDDQLDTVRT
jgi:hypothetical protein